MNKKNDEQGCGEGNEKKERVGWLILNIKRVKFT